MAVPGAARRAAAGGGAAAVGPGPAQRASRGRRFGPSRPPAASRVTRRAGSGCRPFRWARSSSRVGCCASSPRRRRSCRSCSPPPPPPGSRWPAGRWLERPGPPLSRSTCRGRSLGASMRHGRGRWCWSRPSCGRSCSTRPAARGRAGGGGQWPHLRPPRSRATAGFAARCAACSTRSRLVLAAGRGGRRPLRGSRRPGGADPGGGEHQVRPRAGRRSRFACADRSSALAGGPAGRGGRLDHGGRGGGGARRARRRGVAPAGPFLLLAPAPPGALRRRVAALLDGRGERWAAAAGSAEAPERSTCCSSTPSASSAAPTGSRPRPSSAARWCATGGHNPLEPAVWGVPVLSGPHVFNFRERLSTSSCGRRRPPGRRPRRAGRSARATGSRTRRRRRRRLAGRAVIDGQPRRHRPHRRRAARAGRRAVAGLTWAGGASPHRRPGAWPAPALPRSTRLR